MPKGLTATVQAHDGGTGVIPKYPTWYTLPQQPVTSIQADHRYETDIDVNGVGRIRLKLGYNVSPNQVRYTY